MNDEISQSPIRALVDKMRARQPSAPPEMTWKQRRRNMEAMMLGLPSLPDDVYRWPDVLSDVPVEWIATSAAGSPSVEALRRGPVIVYLHGGGYTLGSIKTHRYMMARLARTAGCAVVGVDYRLAPEHPCPAAIEDTVRVYRQLLDLGVDPARSAFAGDSAGGGLALSSLAEIKRLGLDLPAALVLLSPWTDLTISLPSHTERVPLDPMVTPAGLELMAAAYAGSLTRDDPRVSPLRGDLREFPPALIQVGTAEVLYDDSVHLAQELQEAGSEVVLETWDEMIHVFQAFPQLPESGQALHRIGSFLNARGVGPTTW